MFGHVAHDVRHPELIASVGQCLAASSAAAILIVLSWFNAVHSPAFDCVRAGAYLLRSRRTAAVPLVRAEIPAVRVHAPPIAVLLSKEGSHVRD
jgi:hypothetical protein